ncbi:hypothetical protein [Pararhizobium qamdonense]|uniref:hypothetical protein n=1 Tax=Pararhizobium qamdonense TaxID=3031126 RepID=UPI0023E22036|nr:hypothetical protein [Pararhizobium qamdonense]
MTSHLYRISRYKRALEVDAGYPDTRWYEGQLVFAGPDAAIEVMGKTINGYIGGTASHPEGQLASLINEYKTSIRKEARALRLADTVAVILSGKWHHVDPDQDPRFEAYLVHLVAGEGNVVTQRYSSQIFGWDNEGYNDGREFFGGGGRRLVDDVASLRGHAELKLAPGKFLSPCGMYALEGVVWFPVSDQSLPIVYSNVNGPDAPARSMDAGGDINPAVSCKQLGDGTLLGELRAREQALKGLPGVFRGKTVDRSAHRPDEMTLGEAFASTDILGYWHQVDDGSDELLPTFELLHDSEYLEEVITPVDTRTDDWTFGSEYATDWKPLGDSMPTCRSRILAVGSLPEICRDPL